MSRLDKLRHSRFICDDAATVPDRMELAPAERVVFDQIHLPDSSGIMSDHTQDYLDLQTWQSIS